MQIDPTEEINTPLLIPVDFAKNLLYIQKLKDKNKRLKKRLKEKNKIIEENLIVLESLINSETVDHGNQNLKEALLNIKRELLNSMLPY